MDDFTPVDWLMSCVDVANNKARSGPTFKVLRFGDSFVEVLHIESGEAWRFNTVVLSRREGKS